MTPTITLSNPNDWAEMVATTDGYVIVSRTGSVGGGGGIILPGVTIVPPVAANFSGLNMGTLGSVVTNPDWIYLVAGPWSGVDFRCQVETPLATPYTITAGTILSLLLPGDANCGLFLYESSSGKLVTFAIYQQTTAMPALGVAHWPNFTSNAVAGYLVPILTPSPLWLQIQNQGTLINFNYSADGINFITLHSETYNAYFSSQPDGEGFFANSNNGALQSVGITIFSWNRTSP
jgi:hypothetical protein